MLPIHLALVSELREDDLAFDEVCAVAAALDKQVTRDFGPIWDVDATVSAFRRLEDVPESYLAIYIREEIGNEGALGVHQGDGGQVFALVESRWDWPLWASHECLEMLADPSLGRVVAGDSPKAGQGRVEFLIEVCDPCQSAEQAYRVNELALSDFVTPQYYDPVVNPGMRYSFTGGIVQPHQVLPGGYLSWRAADGHLWQAEHQAGQLVIRDAGLIPVEAGAAGLRSFVDTSTPPRLCAQGSRPSVRDTLEHARRRRSARAKTFRHSLVELDKKRADHPHKERPKARKKGPGGDR